MDSEKNPVVCAEGHQGMSRLTMTGLLRSLSGHGIAFCVWKNLSEKQDILDGKTDVDLHVPLCEKRRFDRFVAEQGGIGILAPMSDFPAIGHFLFLGAENRLLHLHVYFDIFSGESHLKNFLLPVGPDLIAGRRADPDLGHVADPALYRTLHVIRHFLKKSSILGLIYHFRERDSYRREDAALAEKTAPVGFLDDGFLDLLNRRMGHAGILKTWWLGLRLRWRLRGLKRISPLRAAVDTMLTMTRRVENKIFANRRKLLSPVGSFVVLTGLDGAGKTSLLENLYGILGRKFVVHSVHMGRPPATLATLPLRAALHMRRRLAGRGGDGGDGGETGKARAIGVVAALRYVALAYERNRLGRRILNRVSKGHLVLCDRFPSRSLNRMDSPRIGTDSDNVLIRRLGHVEHRLYATIPPPDLLIEVRVPVELAQARNRARVKEGKETEAELALRHAENSGLTYVAKQHVTYWNTGSLADGTRKIMSLIWGKALF